MSDYIKPCGCDDDEWCYECRPPRKLDQHLHDKIADLQAKLAAAEAERDGFRKLLQLLWEGIDRGCEDFDVAAIVACDAIFAEEEMGND